MKISQITTFFIAATMLVSGSAALAVDGAELFVRLTCNTCHGTDGKGMIRTKTKARYRLKKKVFRKLKKANVPASIITNLKPLNKVKFTEETKFLDAVRELLGPKDTRKYQAIIIESAGRVFYRKGDRVPGFEGYPILAGNKKIYLFRQMTDILNGRRVNGNTKAMRGIQPHLANNKITEKELKIIAEYLSKVQ